MIEPYYQIDFNAVGCKFEVRVNDISLLSMTIENQAATMIPLNSGIARSGTQKLYVKISPPEGQEFLHPETVFKYDIKSFDVRYGFELKNTIEGHTFPKVDPAKKLRFMEYSQQFQAEVPYTIDTWQGGTLLADIDADELNERLRRAYSRLATFIRNKDYNQLKRELERREQTMATSMYLGSEAMEARLNSLIEDIDAGFQVMPMQPGVFLDLSGNGRLAAYRKLNGEPALTLFNHETGEELMLDLNFFIPAGRTEFEVI